MTFSWFYSSIAVIICIFNVILTESQSTVCYGINGNVSELFPTNDIFNARGIHCPNFPLTSCSIMINNYTFYGNYDMTNEYSLSFTLDYELPSIYGDNDKTEIYYNCGKGYILGLTINKDNGNAFHQTSYMDNGFILDNNCDNNNNITIKIQQTLISDNINIFFTFENLCVGPLSQNIISNDDDPIFRGGITQGAIVSNVTVPICFSVNTVCVNPTILLNHIPIYGSKSYIEYFDDNNNTGICDIDEIQTPSCNTTEDRSQCPPISLGNIINANETKCLNIIVPDDVEPCPYPDGYNYTLIVHLELFCDKTLQPTNSPTNEPTIEPTITPSINPTNAPTFEPTIEPTKHPTSDTNRPTLYPTFFPTTSPTFGTHTPSIYPSLNPTNSPTIEPTIQPTNSPSIAPSIDPTTSAQTDTNAPSIYPTMEPTFNTHPPTIEPTNSPKTDTLDPTIEPTNSPTDLQKTDTLAPTIEPSIEPTNSPSNSPTFEPKINPTNSSEIVTDSPSIHPSIETTTELNSTT